MNNYFALSKNRSSFDFEVPREIQDALSRAQNAVGDDGGGGGGGGGGGSVYSSNVSRLRTSQSQKQPSTRINDPRNFDGDYDDNSLAFSTSLKTNLQVDNTTGK